MVSEKILMTSPYPEMTKIIEEVSDELNISLRIIEATMTEAAQLVQEAVQQYPDIDIIISRAGTLKEIERCHLELPLLHCDNSDFDILKAFWKAKKFGRKMAFLTYQEEHYPYNVSLLNEILGSEIYLYPYQSRDEVLLQIDQMKADSIEVVVGGGNDAQRIVQDKGMHGMHISTNARTISRAIISANDIINHRVKAREHAQRLNAILDIMGEAVIVTDRDSGIIYFNPAAEEVLKVGKESVMGLTHADILSHPSLSQIIKATNRIIKIGHDNYIIESKDVDITKGVIGKVYILKAVKKIQQLETQIRREISERGLVAIHQLESIVHKNEKMVQLIHKAKKYASAESTILITGESGTGKELLSQGIHLESIRQSGPFVAINCAALSESLLESELFGYDHGAFTGAKKGGKSGLFEMANAGTIFLDEIGEISPKIQGMLLRVLQERQVMRVGGDRVIPVNVRIIAATNKNLWESVLKGKFREDLFFRLNVLRLHIPPLRDRIDDIPLMVNHLMFKHKASNLRWDKLPGDLKNFFLSYEWPGNIRQLENVLERLVLSMDTLTNLDDMIEEILYENRMMNDSKVYSNHADHVMDINNKKRQQQIVLHPDTMENMKMQILEQMLILFDQNKKKVSEKLGISRTTLWNKLKNH